MKKSAFVQVRLLQDQDSFEPLLNLMNESHIVWMGRGRRDSGKIMIIEIDIHDLMQFQNLMSGNLHYGMIGVTDHHPFDTKSKKRRGEHLNE